MKHERKETIEIGTTTQISKQSSAYEHKKQRTIEQQIKQQQRELRHKQTSVGFTSSRAAKPRVRRGRNGQQPQFQRNEPEINSTLLFYTWLALYISLTHELFTKKKTFDQK